MSAKKKTEQKKSTKKEAEVTTPAMSESVPEPPAEDEVIPFDPAVVEAGVDVLKTDEQTAKELGVTLLELYGLQGTAIQAKIAEMGEGVDIMEVLSANERMQLGRAEYFRVRRSFPMVGGRVMVGTELGGVVSAFPVRKKDGILLGLGGAPLEYCIATDAIVLEDGKPANYFAMLTFQNGPIADCGVNGVQGEELIKIVIDRLMHFQRGPHPCEENNIAINHLCEALNVLNNRTLDRRARGVEGYQKD